MVAASAGFSKACALLLENGANLYSVDQNGKKYIFKKKHVMSDDFIQIQLFFIVRSIVKIWIQLV